jgi:hypothetical protein
MKMTDNSKGKIWRVRDELVWCGEPASINLKMMGFDVEDYIFNPDRAYEELSRERGEGLAVVDVSLVGRLKGDGKYTSKSTSGFYLTGVKLMGDLIKANPDKFPAHAMMFTIADPKTKIYSQAKEFCRIHRIPLLEGRDHDGYTFGEAIKDRYAQVFRR